MLEQDLVASNLQNVLRRKDSYVISYFDISHNGQVEQYKAHFDRCEKQDKWLYYNAFKLSFYLILLRC